MTADLRTPTPNASSSSTTRFAVLTPAGRGAIATIAIRGADAAAIVGKHFLAASGKPLESLAVGRVAFERFFISPQAAEEVVVGRAGADAIEIHCHGGMAVVGAICNALHSDGCVFVEPDQWVHEHERDALAAQAMLALGRATTERTAAILRDQYRGALGAAIANIQQLLADRDTGRATLALQKLLAHADLGLHLTRPWQVVVAGPPNAGKSSLVNAILGYQRAIVWHQPGTTRDVLTAATAIEGWPIELADTAGLRNTDDPLEAEGVLRAQRQIARSDLVLFVTETTGPWDQLLYDSARATARRLIVVHNKCDSAPRPAHGRPLGVGISAKTGAGIDTLSAEVAKSLVPDPPARGEAVPFELQQAEFLKTALDRATCGEPDAALAQLAGLARHHGNSRDYNDQQ